jgi:hypothetical protein
LNAEIKTYAKAKGVRLYEVAEALKIRPSEFSVKYMRQAEPAQNKMLQFVIDEIAAKKREPK